MLSSFESQQQAGRRHRFQYGLRHDQRCVLHRCGWKAVCEFFEVSGRTDHTAESSVIELDLGAFENHERVVHATGEGGGALPLLQGPFDGPLERAVLRRQHGLAILIVVARRAATPPLTVVEAIGPPELRGVVC